MPFRGRTTFIRLVRFLVAALKPNEPGCPIGEQARLFPWEDLRKKSITWRGDSQSENFCEKVNAFPIHSRVPTTRFSDEDRKTHNEYVF